METPEVMKTSDVSGVSKLNFAALPNFAFAHAWLTKYEAADATTMMMRIMKIQTSSWTWTLPAAATAGSTMALAAVTRPESWVAATIARRLAACSPVDFSI